MKIRPAAPDDAQVLWEAESAAAAVPGQLVSRPDEISVASITARIRDALRTGGFFVAEDDGRLVGHAVLEPMGLRAIQHVWRLTIVVHAGRIGAGIGTALLRYVQEWAMARAEIHKVELLVRATNLAALRLYARLGFEEEGLLRDRIRLPSGEFVDDVAMAWFPHGRTR